MSKNVDTGMSLDSLQKDLPRVRVSVIFNEKSGLGIRFWGVCVRMYEYQNIVGKRLY